MLILKTSFSASPSIPEKVAAAVMTTGYFGFLSGPPLIGFAAELLTLRGALGLVVVLSATIAVLAQTVAGQGSQSYAVDPRPTTIKHFKLEQSS